MKINEIPTFYTIDDLIRTVEELGFLPYFQNNIPGFSVEEHCDPRYFSENIDGPWEWKGPVIRESKCVYGKYFQKKAGFISKKWFADFMNYRRDGYDFDARFNDHLATNRQRQLFELLDQQDSMLSITMREHLGLKKGQEESVINQLFMMGYITTSDFVYKKTKKGIPYGWGVARYATIERYYGDDYIQKAYLKDPVESYRNIIEHLKSITDAAEDDVIKLIRL
ncbi:MAG: hypothetical protein J6P61_05290 [Erysipelotrichaceae bacterium]|nr:hypothetical protein [Erysipelotrichaceae bacterium]